MDSLFPAEGSYSQNYMSDQSRLQISELQFDKLSTLSTFSCEKMRFNKTQVSACSSSPSGALLWIKKVEVVDSVDDFKSSHSIQGHTDFPNFEMLDARIAFALNKIVQKDQKEDRFFSRGRQIAYMITFLITLIYSQSLFVLIMFRKSIQNGMKFPRCTSTTCTPRRIARPLACLSG